MRKLWLMALTIGWVGVLAGLLIWVTRGTSELQDVKSDPEGIVTVEDRDKPFFISSLRARTYDSVVKTERKVRETDKFSSYVTSYDSDGLKQYALMNVPKGAVPINGWPVVVVNHGHIPPGEYSTENSYINTSAYYASQGYLVVKPDYRGHGKSEGEADGVLSRINYAVDVLNLIAGINKLNEANSERIYMYGHSMGGEVSLRVLEVCQTCVKAVTLWAPAVTDWPESFLYFARRSDTADPERQERLARRLRELEDNFVEEEYDLVSTFENVKLVESPVIIQHATGDESVPFEWGEALYKKLIEAGKSVELFTYRGDNHDIAGNWNTALARDVEFFERIM